jgi:hypothetical protein
MTEEINAGIGPEKPKGQIRGIWAITIIIVIAMLVGGAVWYYYYRGIQNQDLGNVSFVKQPSGSPSASASASPSTSGTNETAGWKTYTNSGHGFSIKYPTDWEYQEYSEPQNAEGTTFFETSKKSSYTNKTWTTDVDYPGEIAILVTREGTAANVVSKLKSYETGSGGSYNCQFADKEIAGKTGKTAVCSTDSGKIWYYLVDNNGSVFSLMTKTETNNSTLNNIVSTFKFL